MNERVGLLGGLLAAQLLIVAGILVGDVVGSAPGAERFLTFDPAAVAKFTVAEADESVLLLREGEGDEAAWRLAGGLPADGAANLLTGDDLSEYENAAFNSYRVEAGKLEAP